MRTSALAREQQKRVNISIIALSITFLVTSIPMLVFYSLGAAYPSGMKDDQASRCIVKVNGTSVVKWDVNGASYKDFLKDDVTKPLTERQYVDETARLQWHLKFGAIIFGTYTFAAMIALIGTLRNSFTGPVLGATVKCCLAIPQTVQIMMSISCIYGKYGMICGGVYPLEIKVPEAEQKYYALYARHVLHVLTSIQVSLLSLCACICCGGFVAVKVAESKLQQ